MSLEPELLLLGAVAAFAAAVITGMTGMGGGLVLALALTPLVGVKAIVPVVGVAMLIAHSTRVWVYRDAIVWRPALIMLAAALPLTFLGARVYAELPADAIAAVLGVFLLLIVPLRRFMVRRELRFGTVALALIGAVFGMLAATTIGAGILVIPALLGAGLAGARLLGTDALVGVVVDALKSVAFGGFAVLTPGLAVIGAVAGLCMIPGTYLARWLLERVPLRVHTAVVEALILAGGLSFIWRAV